MYLIDMDRGIIEHRISITTYLRGQIRERKLEEPTGFRRIYRIVHEGTSCDRSTALATASSSALVEALSHRRGWWRDAAQRLIVERGDRSVVADLVRLASGAPDWRTRLHAIWTLESCLAPPQRQRHDLRPVPRIQRRPHQCGNGPRRGAEQSGGRENVHALGREPDQ